MKSFHLLIAISFSLLATKNTAAQSVISGRGYKYSIEMPRGFHTRASTGKHVDLSMAGKTGASINVVVTKLPPVTAGTSVWSMNEYPEDDIKTVLEQSLDNVTILKKGTMMLNGQKAMFVRYTTTSATSGETSYSENIMLWRNGYQYLISPFCDVSERDSLGPIFYRAIQSFHF